MGLPCCFGWLIIAFWGWDLNIGFGIKIWAEGAVATAPYESLFKIINLIIKHICRVRLPPHL